MCALKKRKNNDRLEEAICVFGGLGHNLFRNYRLGFAYPRKRFKENKKFVSSKIGGEKQLAFL